MISQHWCAHVYVSIEEGPLWIRPYFSITQLVLFRWLVKSEVNGGTAAVFSTLLPGFVPKSIEFSSEVSIGNLVKTIQRLSENNKIKIEI